MNLSEVIQGIEHEMFTKATKRNCGNCEWWADNEVCVCDKSSEVADFTDKEFCCDCHEFEESENDE